MKWERNKCHVNVQKKFKISVLAEKELLGVVGTVETQAISLPYHHLQE